jgi:flagellar basal body-associated protein FliL
MEESSSKIKKILAILLAILFVVSLTAVSVSATHHSEHVTAAATQGSVRVGANVAGATNSHFVNGWNFGDKSNRWAFTDKSNA